MVTANDPLIDPAGICTDAGTDAVVPPVNETDAPPAGADAVSRAVPVTVVPPTTLDALIEIVDSAEETAATGGTTTTGVVGLGAVVEPHCVIAIDAISTAPSRARPPRVAIFRLTSCSS